MAKSGGDTKTIKSAEDLDVMDVVKMLLNKYPVYTMCFVCLALYGLSMILFFQRDKETQDSEPWVE